MLLFVIFVKQKQKLSLNILNESYHSYFPNLTQCSL